jgi:hypothetical protein
MTVNIILFAFDIVVHYKGQNISNKEALEWLKFKKLGLIKIVLYI